MPPPEDDPTPNPQPQPRGSGGGAPGRGARSRSEPAVIALQMEDLTLWVIERVAKFPRDHKFTLGDRLVETCLDIITDLVEAHPARIRLRRHPPLHRDQRPCNQEVLRHGIAKRQRVDLPRLGVLDAKAPAHARPILPTRQLSREHPRMTIDIEHEPRNITTATLATRCHDRERADPRW